MREDEMDLEERSTGWTRFATIAIGIAGTWNVLLGVGALTKRPYFNEHGLLYDNLTFWGWVWLVIGALQILTAILVARRSTAGKALALIGASSSMVVWFFSLGDRTFASILVIALDVLVLYALTAERPYASPWSVGRSDGSMQRGYEPGRHFG
ncbi:MAG TPA: hypothetical protein VHM47_09530 [Actinomycetota bacterium]|jgi:hypothetical protein|nr:hypothetical protein [Actinomycetota bacterium]